MLSTIIPSGGSGGVYTNCCNILKIIRSYHLHCSLLLPDLAGWIVRLISVYTFAHISTTFISPIIILLSYSPFLSRLLRRANEIKEGVKSLPPFRLKPSMLNELMASQLHAAHYEEGISLVNSLVSMNFSVFRNYRTPLRLPPFFPPPLDIY
jgi:hypothetical protein